MKALFLATLLTLVLFLGTTAVAAPTSEARSVVHLLLGPSGSSCSAVAIAPGKALTAKHCAGMDGWTVNGLEVALAYLHPVEDVAELDVPGLECPCAVVSARRPAMDEHLVAVGYPFGQFLLASLGDYQGTTEHQGGRFGIATVHANPGMSGGGVFLVEGGNVFLVGILSGMAPTGSPVLYVEVSGDVPLWPQT